MQNRTDQSRSLQDALLIAGTFALVRLWAWVAGVEFNAESLGGYWQVVDPELLQSRLWPTLLHLHSQPPLFNLLIGVALQAGTAAFPVVMAWTYGAICLGGLLALNALARVVLGSRGWALGIALWFCVSPDVLLFSETLSYDSLVPWLLCIGFYGVHTGVGQEGRRGSALLMLGFSVLAAVVLLRSMFHPIWFVATIGLVAASTGVRIRVLRCAALPAAAIGAVLLKNLVMFGFLGLSSWATLNLVGVTVEKLPDEERRALLAEGILSPLSSVSSFGSVERLLPLLPPVAPTGEPILDAPRKSNGFPNMHHQALLVASRLRWPDVKAAFWADPWNYGAVLMTSVYYFNRPSNEFLDVRRNLAPVEGWARLVNATVGLQPVAWFGSTLDPTRPRAFQLQISYGSLLIGLGFLGACVVAVRRMTAAAVTRRPLDSPATVLLPMLVTGAFVFVVSSCCDVLENNRARYTVAPLLTLGAAFWLRCWLGTLSLTVVRPSRLPAVPRRSS